MPALNSVNKTLSCGVVLFVSISAQAQEVFTDDRDSQEYRSVVIGEQIWMAENLQYFTDQSLCYDNIIQNCESHGRLYTWYDATADDHGNGVDICPTGWHLPSDEEWKVLERHAGLSLAESNAEGWRGSEAANTANKLKSTSNWRYKAVDGNGVDSFNFTILSGGRWRAGPQRFRHIGQHADFWSSTEMTTTRASNRKFTSGKPQDHVEYNGDDSWRIDRGRRPKIDGHSVRCVLDEAPPEIPETALAATVYQHCAYGGYAVDLEPGNYTLQDLTALGVRNNDLSSMNVEEGYEVTIYQNGDFSGNVLVKTSDDNCLVNDRFNDQTSSIVVREL